MRFVSEISKALTAEGLSAARVQYTVIDGGGGYFQNVKKLLEFSDTVIVFQGKKGAVRVEGKNLSLGKYFAGDAGVRGEIFKVERVD